MHSRARGAPPKPRRMAMRLAPPPPWIFLSASMVAAASGVLPGSQPLRLTLHPVNDDPAALGVSRGEGMLAAVRRVEGLLRLRDSPQGPSSGWPQSVVPCKGLVSFNESGLLSNPASAGEVRLLLVANYSQGKCYAPPYKVLAYANVCILPWGEISGLVVLCSWAREHILNVVSEEAVYSHEMVHALGFMNLPNHSPGKGVAAVVEARRAMGCNLVSNIPTQDEGAHWSTEWVGRNEVMSTCLGKGFHISGVTVAVLQVGQLQNPNPEP